MRSEEMNSMKDYDDTRVYKNCVSGEDMCNILSINYGMQ